MLPGIAIFGDEPLVGLLIRYFRNGGFPVVALWSPSAEQASTLANENQIKIHSSNVDRILLLPTVQLIVVAASPHYHSQIASKACGIGKHVVVTNWPPAYSLSEMQSMHSAAANYPSLIALLFTALRHVPALQLMRKLIVDDRLIGSVKTVQAAVLCDVISIYEEKSVIWDKFMGGGLLSLYGSNLIDVISFTTGLQARKVHAMIRTFNPLLSNHRILRNNADDFVTFQMEMYGGNSADSEDIKDRHELENGTDIEQKQRQELHPEIHEHNWAIATVTLNGLHYNHLPEHELIIYGSGGYLAYRNGNLYGKLKQAATSTNATSTTLPATVSHVNGDHNGSGLNSLGHGSCSGGSSGSSSGHESGASSFSKESIFYLDDFDAAYQQHTPAAEALSSLGATALNSGKSSLLSSGSSVSSGTFLTHHLSGSSCGQHAPHPCHHPSSIGHLPPQLLPHTTAKWHLWPELYQRALFHFIATLREAFFGGDTAASGMTANKEGDSSSLPSVHSMFCPPSLTVTSPESMSEDCLPTSAASEGNTSEQFLEQIHWIKDPLSGAANFEDGIYIQSVVEAVKQSNEEHRWICIQNKAESAKNS